MLIDRVKYTKYFKESDEWVGMEATLFEGEDDNVALRSIRDKVNSFHKGEIVVEKVTPPDWTLVKDMLDGFPFREDAMNFLKIEGLTYIKELNDIVALKPLKK